MRVKSNLKFVTALNNKCLVLIKLTLSLYMCAFISDGAYLVLRLSLVYHRAADPDIQFGSGYLIRIRIFNSDPDI